MASFYGKIHLTAKQVAPIIAKLRGVFDALDDEELLKALRGKVHRGCQGHPVEALWRSYVAGYILNIPTVASLVRMLTNNADLCDLCGLKAVPSEATYSRFVARLTKHSNLVNGIIEKSVTALGKNLPNFGRTVAVDSSAIDAYSQSRKPSDPDARWAKKGDKHGKDKWWFGYKVHVVADVEYELPVQVEVTPANLSDTRRMIPLLLRLTRNPSFVLADAGYDSADNYAFIYKVLAAEPIIKMNKRGAQDRPATPHRAAAFVKMHREARELRLRAGIERRSSRWETLYSQRTGIERLFSRMKEFRRLGSLHHRGLAKVTLHAYLSTLTMVASALSASWTSESVRRVA